MFGNIFSLNILSINYVYFSISGELDKSLTLLQSETQKLLKNEHARQIFLGALSKSLVRLLWQMEWDARLVKKLIKVNMHS